MSLRKTALAFAAASLAVSPVAAQATERASPPTTEANEVSGAGWIGIVATIAVVILAVIAATRDDNDPVSP